MNATEEVLDSIELKHRLSCGLASDDPKVKHTIVLYMVYHTIKANERLTVNSVKALLCGEYMVAESSIDAAIAGLISRSMFNCVERWKASGRTIGEMLVSVTEPPPNEFTEWLRRAEDKMPELKVFTSPIYLHKKQA